MTSKMTAFATFALSLAFAASPVLVADFNGFDADQFPVPQDDPPVQPAGYAFAIWGVIYLWLIAGMGFGLLRRADDAGWQAMRGPLCLSLAVGAAQACRCRAQPGLGIGPDLGDADQRASCTLPRAPA